MSPIPGGNVRLDFEVVPVSQNFSGIGITQGTLVASGQESRATITLPFGEYKWRARATTDANTSSGWQEFGNVPNQTDFRLFVEPPAAELDDNKDRCGLTGLEVLALAGLLALRRRRRA